MEIATGYFAKANTYHNMGYALVSIARTTPWFIAKELNVYSCQALNPTDEILALKDNPPEYEKRYNEEILKKSKAIDIYHSLHLIAHQEGTDKVVLMCYEGIGKFCHRYIVAKWLKDKLGMDVNEIDFSTYEKRQRELFESCVM